MSPGGLRKQDAAQDAVGRRREPVAATGHAAAGQGLFRAGHCARPVGVPRRQGRSPGGVVHVQGWQESAGGSLTSGLPPVVGSQPAPGVKGRGPPASARGPHGGSCLFAGPGGRPLPGTRADLRLCPRWPRSRAAPPNRLASRFDVRRARAQTSGRAVRPASGRGRRCGRKRARCSAQAAGPRAREMPEAPEWTPQTASPCRAVRPPARPRQLPNTPPWDGDAHLPPRMK